MNDMVKRDSLSALAAIASSAGGGGGGDLLRLLRDGVWVYGAENEEPDPDSEWAINPFSFEHGYISWADSQVVGEVMVPHTTPQPPRNTLNDTGANWDSQLSFRLKCIKGPDKDLEVTFKTTSVGGTRAIGNMAKAIAGRASEGEENVVPVVLLAIDSYQHKKYGKIYTPVFEIVRWVSIDDPEKKVEEEKPVRRRRARTA